MFWLLFWLLSLFIFLVLPAVCIEDNRKRWLRRFRECRWNVDGAVNATASLGTNGRNNNNNNNRRGPEGFHYVLSKAQEDDIREAFLLDKIKHYTLELNANDIERPDGAFGGTGNNGDDDDENKKGETKGDNVVDTDGTVEEENEKPNNSVCVGDNHEDIGDSSREKANTTRSDGDMDEGLTAESCVVNAEDSETGENTSAEPIVKTGITTVGETVDLEEGRIPFHTVQESHEETKIIHATVTGETELATMGGTIQDDVSDTGSSDGEMMEVISFNGNEDGLVSIPMAGECRHDVLPQNVKGTQRKEPNGCAICLCPFEISDMITWSNNPACQHVFHEDCIKGWLMASGRKYLKRQRREQRRTGNLSYDSDPVSKITGFPMLCPCCRQHFIMPEEDEESVDEKAAAPEGNEAEMGNTEAMLVAAS